MRTGDPGRCFAPACHDSLLCSGCPVSVPLRHTIARSVLATQHSRKWLDGMSDALAYEGYLLDTAVGIPGSCPVRTWCLNVTVSRDPDKVFERACALYRELDQGYGVLVLTDLYGSTPSNIAARLLEKYNILVILGVNVPTLVRILNYPTYSLEDMANKALTGARDGVVITARKLAS